MLELWLNPSKVRGLSEGKKLEERIPPKHGECVRRALHPCWRHTWRRQSQMVQRSEPHTHRDEGTGSPGRGQPGAGSSQRPGLGSGPSSENLPPISPPGPQKPGGALRVPSSRPAATWSAWSSTVWLRASPGVGGTDAPSETWSRATPGARKATVVTAARTRKGRKRGSTAASVSDIITHEAIFLEK